MLRPKGCIITVQRVVNIMDDRKRPITHTTEDDEKIIDQCMRDSENGNDSEYLPDRLPSRRSGQS